MKPTFPFTDDVRRTPFFAREQASRSLQTDYNFQAGAVREFSGNCNGKSFPPFHRLSEDYLNGEARIHFAVEAAIFGLIVLTAAVPVIESVQGLLRLVNGTF